jgi:pilus assembly protein CpaF
MGRGRRWRTLAGLAEPQINACDLDLLIALNSGIPSMCSLRAISAREALVEMCTLPLLAGENVSVALTAVQVPDAEANFSVHSTLFCSGRQVWRFGAPCRRSYQDDPAAVTVFLSRRVRAGWSRPPVAGGTGSAERSRQLGSR